MNLEGIVGTATVISSLAGRFVGYPAQIRLILKTRMVSNLSTALHTIGFISCLLWTWHGWLQGDWVILLTQGLAGIAATGSMLFLIWRFRPSRVAQEHLMSLLVQLALVDGEKHEREQEEIERFARQWNISARAVDEAPPGPGSSGTTLLHLDRYLESRPPVAQLRDLRDMVWLLVEADGTVTSAERDLVTAITVRLDQALKPYNKQDIPSFRVVAMPRTGSGDLVGEGIALGHGMALVDISGQSVWASDVALTEFVARQLAKELRAGGWLAMAVDAGEVGA